MIFSIRRALLGVALSTTLVGGALGTMDSASAAEPASATAIVSHALNGAPAVDGASALAANPTASAGGVTVTAVDKANSVSRHSAGGGQVLTVLRSKSTTAAKFTLSIPAGAQVRTLPSGGVAVFSSKTAYAQLDAPWALDAAGKMLPTSYTIHGTTIIQKVDTTNATFPIVADPSFSLCDWYTAVCMKTSYWETRQISDTFFVGVGAAVATLCGIIPWSPWYVGAVKVACAGIVAAYFYALRGTFDSARSQGRCVQLHFNYTPYVFLRSWGVVNC